MKKICNLYNYPSHYRKLIYEMMDNEFECTFVFGDEKLGIKQLDLAKFKNATIKHIGYFKKIGFQWGILSYAFKQYDAYILTSATNNITHWLFLALVKLIPNKKTYIWNHGIYGNENKKQLLIRRIFCSLIDGYFVYGEFAQDNMITTKVCPKHKIHVIHNSLNYDEQLVIRKSLHHEDIYTNHFGNNNPVMVFIGRLTKIKRLDLILEAMAILKTKGKKYNFVFIGDGTEKEFLINKSIQLDINNQVWFYGSCYNEIENAKLIYNSDLCISPGNVGLTALHSMMFGTPVITHNNFSRQMPEFQTIIEGKTGLFFEENNVLSLSETIEHWFDNYQIKREKVRENCYDIIDREWNPYYQISLLKKVL